MCAHCTSIHNHTFFSICTSYNFDIRIAEHGHRLFLFQFHGWMETWIFPYGDETEDGICLFVCQLPQIYDRGSCRFSEVLASQRPPAHHRFRRAQIRPIRAASGHRSGTDAAYPCSLPCWRVPPGSSVSRRPPASLIRFDQIRCNLARRRPQSLEFARGSWRAGVWVAGGWPRMLAEGVVLGLGFGAVV